MSDEGLGPRRIEELHDDGVDLPLGVCDLRERAAECLDDGPRRYLLGGAGSEETMRSNREAFRRWRLVPRVLRDVAGRELSTSPFGRDLAAPLALAPIGPLSIFHEGGAPAVARAAGSLGVPIVASTLTSHTLEEVADAAGDAPRWFQLYPSADRAVNESLLRRAEEAGYDVVVVTVDAPVPAWRERTLDGSYFPHRAGEGVANYLADPAFREGLERPPEEDREAAIERVGEIFADPARSWGDLRWLDAKTDLPIVVKGVLHPDDAREAAERADGIVVSNHGGRQIDGEVAALSALPEVVRAVDGRVPVLFDSGIRSGSDVAKALALGADVVLLGRPYVYGLALAGEAGVRAVVSNVLAELDLTLGLLGRADVSGLDRSALVRADGSQG